MAIIRKSDGRYIRLSAVNINGQVQVETYKDKAHRTEFKAIVPTPQFGLMGGMDDNFVLLPKQRGMYLPNLDKKLKNTMGEVDKSINDSIWALAYAQLKLATEMNAEEFTDDV